MLKVFHTDNPDAFKLKALFWADSFDTSCFFDSNKFADPYSAFGVYIGAGKAAELTESGKNSFAALDDFLAKTMGYIPGYFSYELKNETEDLISENPD